jgi:hypothetical protein
MARDYIAQMKPLIAADKQAEIRKVAEIFQTKVFKYLENALSSPDGADRARKRLATYTASRAAFGDLTRMVTVLSAAEQDHECHRRRRRRRGQQVPRGSRPSAGIAQPAQASIDRRPADPHGIQRTRRFQQRRCFLHEVDWPGLERYRALVARAPSRTLLAPQVEKRLEKSSRDDEPEPPIRHSSRLHPSGPRCWLAVDWPLTWLLPAHQ